MTERRENIARAIRAACRELHSTWRVTVSASRHLADAAIAADDLRGRVLALAEELETEAFDAGRGSEAKAVSYAAADRLRALLDGADQKRTDQQVLDEARAILRRHNHGIGASCLPPCFAAVDGADSGSATT